MNYLEIKTAIEHQAVKLVDVRTKEEYQAGHIQGAILIPVDKLEIVAHNLLPNKNTKVIVYCHSGSRSAFAYKILIYQGYTNVYDLGGVIDWPYELEK